MPGAARLGQNDKLQEDDDRLAGLLPAMTMHQDHVCLAGNSNARLSCHAWAGFSASLSAVANSN